MSHRRTTMLAAAWLLAITVSPARAMLLSDFIDDITTLFAGGQPIPDNLFDTSQNFANTTLGGGPTLAATWEQTVVINRTNPVDTGGGVLRDQFIDVSERGSEMLFYESAVSGTNLPGSDPIFNSSFDMGGPMTLQIQDGDLAGGTPFDPFINDLPGLTGLDPGTPIHVWQTFQAVDVEIVALTLTGLQPIATNSMVAFQFFGDDTVNPVLDNAFGIFLDDWTLPLGKDVLLSSDGTPTGSFIESDFLEEWVPLVPVRWKGHPSGWQAIPIGAEIPGPAGILHLPRPVPEPATIALFGLGLAGIGFSRIRRRG